MRIVAAVTLVIALVAAWAGDAAAAGKGAWRSLGLYPTSSGGGRGGPASGASLPMVDSDVELAVRGSFVDATVTQTFVNRSSRATEATYVFPLPADAVVTAMTIEVDGRRIVAKIEERAAAQAKYEEAVRAGVMAATLEQERADVFTQTVSAVPPKGRVKVTLRYDSLARYAKGGWSLVLPMVVAPRFVPGVVTGRGASGSGRSPDTDRAPDASRITPGASPGGGGATAVRVTFVDPVTKVASVTHDIAATKKAGTFAFKDARTDHDAVVTWQASRPVTAWLEKNTDGSAFAAVVVQADDTRPAARAAVRAYVIVDHAATMKGDASAVAQPFSRALFAALGANDRARVHGATATGWEKPADAARSLELVTRTAQGPFDLTRVLAAVRPERAPIVLVTSGLIADDAAAIAAAKRIGVPIHVVGVGPAPARGLLEQIAAVTNGTVRYVLPGDELDVSARDLVAAVANGGTPIAINWGALSVRDMVPVHAPRLGPGQAMVAVARVAGTVPSAVNVRVRGELVALTAFTAPRVDAALTVAGPLARRWAKLRLDDLLVGTRDAKAITQLALTYGLVSPYTSLVAVGEKVVVEGGVKHSVAVPVSVPAGMRWDDVRTETSPAIAPETPVVKVPPPPSPAPPVVTKSPVQPRPPATQSPTQSPSRPVATKPDTRRPRPEPVATTPTRVPDRTPVAAGPAPERKPVAVDRVEDAHEPGMRDEDEEGDSMPPRAGAADRALDHDEASAPDVAVMGSPMAREVESDSQSVAISVGRRTRIAAHVNGGIVHTRADNAGLLAAGARLEYRVTSRVLAGVEGSLLVVDTAGTDVRGRALLAASIVNLGTRYLELGLGAGAQFAAGDGATTGPAWSAGLRLHIPGSPRWGIVFRYDGARFSFDDRSLTEHAVTGGLEWTF